jgi:hypothetical protein
MKGDKASFIRSVRNPFKFRLFLWSRLPMAAIAGLKIVAVDEEHAVTRIKCRWLTQNPFKSTFWAVMGMAAEMSSGILVMMHGEQKVSMYVTGCRAVFIKRATGTSFYSCRQGTAIRSAIEQCIQDKSSASIDCTTIVTDSLGEKIAEFVFTWSVKGR